MAEQVIATVVGPGTVVRGEIRCAGDLIVHGRIEGAVSCGGALRLEPGGAIEAEVRARSALIAGRIRGDVSVVEEAELAASCRMLGDLRAARVTIAPGAAVRGRVELGDVGSDEEAVWAAFDDAPDEAGLGSPAALSLAELVSPPATEVAQAVPALPLVTEVAQAVPPSPPATEVAQAAPALPPVTEVAQTAPPSPPATEVAQAAPPSLPATDVPQAAPAPPGPDHRTSEPPPIPASALALGVRSTIVIKR